MNPNQPQADGPKAMRIAFVILGEPASKANSRQIVTIAGRPSSIKSKKARGTVKANRGRVDW